MTSIAAALTGGKHNEGRTIASRPSLRAGAFFGAQTLELSGNLALLAGCDVSPKLLDDPCNGLRDVDHVVVPSALRHADEHAQGTFPDETKSTARDGNLTARERKYAC